MMKHFLVIGLLSTALLVGCGDTSTEGTGTQNRGGQFDFPDGSKWDQTKFDETRKACANRGSQQDTGTYNEWFSFCGCVYGVASKRWAFEEFSQNFQTYYDQLVDDNTIGQCLKQAGLTN